MKHRVAPEPCDFVQCFASSRPLSCAQWVTGAHPRLNPATTLVTIQKRFYRLNALTLLAFTKAEYDRSSKVTRRMYCLSRTRYFMRKTLKQLK